MITSTYLKESITRIVLLCLFIVPVMANAQTDTKQSDNDSTHQKTDSLANRKDGERYIVLEGIEAEVDSNYIDLVKYIILYDKKDKKVDITKTLEEVERLAADTTKKMVGNPPRPQKPLIQTEYDDVMFFDVKKYSKEIYATLKQTKYVDTTTNIFQSYNNTVGLKGVIKKVMTFEMQPKWPKDDYENRHMKCRMEMRWYFENNYGEAFDSVNIWAYSDEYSYREDILMDAVKKSYQILVKNPIYMKNIKTDTSFAITDPVLVLKKPVHIVQNAEDAASAAVTIKRKSGGHGSGFAITEDGYILTNYHIIVGEKTNKREEVTVLLPDGSEVPARVVRSNIKSNVVLLKVEATFEKAFSLTNTKSYTKLMQVYTIGTPKTLELGQSISSGILSNERKTANYTLLQLSMSINSGNSGGPLFDQSGTLHGIIIGRLVGYATEGLSFAIPSYLLAPRLNLSFVD